MISSHIARLFATHSFTQIALFSCSSTNLVRDAHFVTSAVPSASVHTYVAEVTDHAVLQAALEKAVHEVGVPEVVVYNVACIKYRKFGEYSTDDIVEDFKIPNLGVVHNWQCATTPSAGFGQSNPSAHPALFVMSGAIVHQPFTPVFSLSMAKTAQASLTKLLADDNKNVVYVALVTVGGPVTPDEEVKNPQNFASRFWDLYKQEKGSWEFEMKCWW